MTIANDLVTKCPAGKVELDVLHITQPGAPNETACPSVTNGDKQGTFPITNKLGISYRYIILSQYEVN